MVFKANETEFESRSEHPLWDAAVQRDPITGLGALPKEHVELGRTRNASTGRPGK
ncbi:unnamed protein product [Schistosoma curassoni]|uniref:Catalase n=1 Tax=Schistosoma curassoni TaxID=6186 RepID=A0A183KFJ7_9TREM|nr:unnamed protein product [Schistosoma curassoni]